VRVGGVSESGWCDDLWREGDSRCEAGSDGERRGHVTEAIVRPSFQRRVPCDRHPGVRQLYCTAGWAVRAGSLPVDLKRVRTLSETAGGALGLLAVVAANRLEAQQLAFPQHRCRLHPVPAAGHEAVQPPQPRGAPRCMRQGGAGCSGLVSLSVVRSASLRTWKSPRCQAARW
jgi:hypothetical protein